MQKKQKTLEQWRDIQLFWPSEVRRRQPTARRSIGHRILPLCCSFRGRCCYRGTASGWRATFVSGVDHGCGRVRCPGMQRAVPDNLQSPLFICVPDRGGRRRRWRGRLAGAPAKQRSQSTTVHAHERQRARQRALPALLRVRVRATPATVAAALGALGAAAHRRPAPLVAKGGGRATSLFGR